MRAIPVCLGLVVGALIAAEARAQVPENTQDSGRIVLLGKRPPLVPFVREANRAAQVVARARTFLDVPWVFSGRSSEGIDCIGLVFLSMAETYGVSRRGYDRHNSRNAEVAARLGAVVATFSAQEIVSGDARVGTTIREGDVLFFLWPLKNPVEPAFATLGEDDLWVWHVGLATGPGRVLHAGPWLGKVAEEPLVSLVTNASFAGVAVVRPGSSPP